MTSSTVIEHADKIGVGTYPLYGLGAMLDGVHALDAGWFYTWGGQLPSVDLAGWSVGAAANLGGTSADHDLQLGAGPDAWASQDIAVAGNLSLRLSFSAQSLGGSAGGVVIDYLNASGAVIGSSYQAIGAAGGAFQLDAVTPTGTAAARLIAYTASGQGIVIDDVSVRTGGTERLRNGGFEQATVPQAADLGGFVPMVWGAADMAKLAAITAAPSANLLTFNEPDNRDQSNMTVQQALSWWPQLMATGKRLGSPATTVDGALGADSWLGQFMSGAAAAGYRVDFVAVHYYSADPDVTKFKDFLQQVHDAYGKPVWVTEWLLADWSVEGRFTAQQQQDFFVAATQMMDDLPFVERQSWFAAYDGLDSWDLNTGLLTTDGQLTAIGTSFAGLASAVQPLSQTLTGGDGSDVLVGGTGDDMLDGGLGSDRMTGGAGDDTYVANDAGDVVVENPGEGHDTIRTALKAFDLSARGANVEDLVFTGTTSFAGTGNALDNLIVGGAAADRLDGGAGNDVMQGGAGSDVYYVDSAGDQVIEQAGEGVDKVIATTSFTLGANVENLTLVGSGSLTGIGNEANNVIVGSATAVNDLSGAGGNDKLAGGNLGDVLRGGDGSDTLTGGAGADIMDGGAGNDTYFVDDAGDRVNELAGGGNDTVKTSVNFVLAGEIETLTFTGTGNFVGVGSDTANRINGAGGDDRLSGMGGADALYGVDGNDWIDGGAGADMLMGGAGADTLTGGTGADKFVFDRFDIPAGGTDWITDFHHAEGDRIDLSRIDANAGTTANEAFAFIGTAGFSGVAGELRVAVNGDVRQVEGDLNGDRVADFSITLLDMAGAANLVAVDFIL